MAFDIPKADKIYTTVYDNFKGVDYTNDATNIYRRRTPSGVNMIAGLDGTPHKRTGWEVAIDTDDFSEVFGSDVGAGFEIYKCSYFELAGSDHIIMFTNIGVFTYRTVNNLEETLSDLVFLTDDPIVRTSYDRAFFFDADGESGFYIYGDFKVWKYHYDEDTDFFKFEEVAPTVPTIRISVKADGSSGEMNEGANLLTNMVAEEFQNNIIAYVSSKSVPSGVVVDDDLFVINHTIADSYSYVYDDGGWLDNEGTYVTLASEGIVIPSTVSPTAGMRITVNVSYRYRTYLAYSVPTEEAGKIEIYVSDTMKDGQFGIKLDGVKTAGIPTPTQPLLVRDTSGSEPKTYIEYTGEHLPLIEGEDAIRIVYPSVVEEITSYSYPSSGYVEATVKVGGGA